MAAESVEELVWDEEEAICLLREKKFDGRILRLAARRGYLNVFRYCFSPIDASQLRTFRSLNYTNEAAADEDGITPLHLAASNGHIAVVKALLSSDLASVHVEDKKRETPLYKAYHGGHRNIVNVLLNYGADAYHCSLNVDKSLIDIAASRCDWDMVECLLKTSQTFPSSLNFRKLIIEGEVDPNIVDTSGHTLLHKAMVVDGLELFDYLLQNNVLVDARDIYSGKTPLHIACAYGRNDVISFLIDHGASINTKDAWKQTPLYCSVRSNNIEATKILLEKGADINIKCGCGDATVLHCAGFNHLVQITHLLLDWGADVNAKDKNSYTPLHNAAETGEMNLLQLFLDKGANINPVNMEGDTPLHCASSKWVKELLLQNGADANIRNKYGFTPLQVQYAKVRHYKRFY